MYPSNHITVAAGGAHISWGGGGAGVLGVEGQTCPSRQEGRTSGDWTLPPPPPQLCWSTSLLVKMSLCYSVDSASKMNRKSYCTISSVKKGLRMPDSCTGVKSSRQTCAVTAVPQLLNLHTPTL